jgi:hypothetical protein
LRVLKRPYGQAESSPEKWTWHLTQGAHSPLDLQCCLGVDFSAKDEG